MLDGKVVTIFGGDGFIGSYITKKLAKYGAVIKIVSRSNNKGTHLKTSGYVGQINFIKANIRSDLALKEAIEGSDIVINAVGILYEKGKQKFSDLHAKIPERMAKYSSELGVKQFIHISALGVDQNSSCNYTRSKFNGENAVLNSFPSAVIIRPSVVFGPEDNFFNKFAKMAKFSPFLPLIGGGKTKFQPVYAKDIANAIIKIADSNEYKSTIFELGGPNIMTFKEIMQYILETIHSKRCLMNIPFPIAYMIGGIYELMPNPTITRDQVTLLKFDNIVDPYKDVVLHFSDLDIKPTPINSIVPDYLELYR